MNDEQVFISFFYFTKFNSIYHILNNICNNSYTISLLHGSQAFY